MKHWTWQNFKSVLIKKLDVTKPNSHFAAHLTSLNEEGKLTWFGILSHHHLFGKKCNFVITNNTDFNDFANAVHMNPANQCTIKILMQDPRVEAKWRELEKAETKNLALTYGTEDQREKLEREKTRLAQNPKANVTGVVRNEKVQEITNHILSKYSYTAKTMRIRDPNDRLRSIRITHKNLWIWSRALLHEAPGVDLDNPPDDPEEFVSDAVCVWTKKEDEETRLAARAKAHPDTEKPGNAKSSNRTPKSKSSNPKTPKSSEQKYTLARRLPNGRIMPPRLIPQNGGASKDTFTSTDHISHSKADNTSRPKSDWSPSPNESLDMEHGDRQSSDGADSSSDKEDDLPSLPIPWESPSSVLEAHQDIPSGESSSNIEVPKPILEVHRSPARKVARSPAGREVNRDFHRLDFANSSRQPSVSPTCKIPSSRVSSSIAAEAQPKAPLTKDGCEMTWDEFLTRSSFAKDNIIVRALLSLNYIPHWDYFCTTSPSVLISELTGMRYPFPHAMAQRLVEGARVLEFTHVQHGYSYSFEV
ncbi:hypothetical protein PCANC_25147 [Puccinia coronata f. sp. avenae]|uniref:Uncharacterized protein n=1 Tax=Puccinia coronata f. sp. avenae TaxID=200324 RepID=A0A2N5TPX2_9BASI|nr:hypothetical protein PCANC_25147 [Puccinia coronata f. sp. avenae]